MLPYKRFQALKNRGMKISCMKISYFHAWKFHIFMHENYISMHENENVAPDTIFLPKNVNGSLVCT